MRTGWRTSELTLAALGGFAILQLCAEPVESLGQGIATGCACLAVGMIVSAYARARGEAKRGA